MGKGKFSLRRKKKGVTGTPQRPPRATDHSSGNGSGNLIAPNVGPSKTAKKKAGGSRLWMRFDRMGQSELMECDKSSIIKRASVPTRDLRILGPIFSQSSSILAREKAMIINLEFVRGIVTAEELLLLDPLRQEVLPFIDQLRHQLPQKSSSKNTNGTNDVQEDDLQFPGAGKWLQETIEGGLHAEQLPFEFQVLEVALEVVCMYLDSNVAELERDAYPVLDELAMSVSTRNLEHVRSLKSNLTRLLARVQKVRDEIEHLLDDNEDMAQLYLSRKSIQNQQSEAMLLGTATTGSNAITPMVPNFRRLGSTRSGSLVSNCLDDDVEDLEMLLEAYFMQLEGTRNKILSVREYIDDTEDYVNIQLDNQRNELIQLQLILTIASFAIAVETLVAGWFGMNIPCTLYNIQGVFWPFVAGITTACIILFFIVLGYARWKKLLGS
ncbi:unnamed protein product [Cuscuta epithymum]|uniref:Magnesium transporter n=2 Tax=Cuscuta epithymum TaxID=186058 RepID=A0AAV0E5Y0_9ASTE|nr:unnamed protein product [Cuscuta epithymum]CAH9121883.1 unnamed protein product [Cuscuta epithymum]